MTKMDRNFIEDDTYEKHKGNTNMLAVLTLLGKESFEKCERNYTLKENLSFLQPDSSDDLRIVVIGKTGVGKSATANAILGEKVFTDAGKADSVTFESRCYRRKIKGRNISVIDTPGLQDTSRSQKEVLREIARVMKIFHDGIHVFVYVLNMASPRFTEEDKTSLSAIEVKFGDNIKKYRMLVYTHAESHLTDGANLEAFCKEQRFSNTAIASFFEELDGNIVAVNNKSTLPAEMKRNQDVILGLADKITKRNDKAVYTNHMFQKASEERRKCIDKLLGQGFNSTVIDSVEDIIAGNPRVTKHKGALILEVRKRLQRNKELQREKILELRMKRAREDIAHIEHEAKKSEQLEEEQKQLMEKAEEKLRMTVEVLNSDVIEKQAEDIGKTHIGILNNLQKYLRKLHFWKDVGVD